MEAGKVEQLQIRVTRAEKERIKRRASSVGKSISEFILDLIFPSEYTKFLNLIQYASKVGGASYSLTEISNLLNNFEAKIISDLPDPRGVADDLFTLNYIAAMIHHLSNKNRIDPPKWIFLIPKLSGPYFGSDLQSLRPYLLTTSPLEYKMRDIFIDSTFEDRV